ncbi:hypothetical protein ACPMJQ_34805 [Streptomyces pseudogriseolus]|uniref:Uncharacterized protein n=1 Tax=Streptomyces sp. R17 TaxID=3238626 RepID=A0AB39NYY3_9ACTN|nr:hypothetical protein [Streptomyces pseudogriseolus]
MALRRYVLFLGFALAVVTGSASALPVIASHVTASVGAEPGRTAGEVETVEPGAESGWMVARIVPRSPRG